MLFALLAAVFSVTGTVVDRSGAAVAGARVTIDWREGTTDVTGTFHFADLPAGEYRVRVEYPGFKAASRRIAVGGARERPRIVLEIAEHHEQVTVGDGEVRVSAEAAENVDALRISREALDRLPVLGNDVVAAASRFLDAGAIGAAGVSLVVDGMEVRRIGVSASAIQEVRINQNPYSAEFARPGRGRIEVITKAAADRFHGSGEFVFRDARLDGRNAFAASRPPEQRRILEGHLTGPLERSGKTGFLISVNHEQEDLQALVYALTPGGTVRENFPTPKRQTEFSAGITRQAAGGRSLAVRYELKREQARGEGVGGFVLPEAGSRTREVEHNVFASHSAVIAPQVVNQFSMRWEHEDLVQASVLAGVRRTVVEDAFTGGGAQSDRSYVFNRVQFNEIVSWTGGKHMVRAGITVPGVTRRSMQDRSNADGTFSFSSLDEYYAGRPFLFEMQRGNPGLVFWQHDLGLFVQDEIKVRKNLTVGAGLRYDRQNHLHSNRNLAPRLSAAFSPDAKQRTVLRAGAGIFYERTGDAAIADRLRFDGIRLKRYVLSSPGYPDPFAGTGSLAASPASVTRFAPGLRSPYIVQYTGGVEQQVRKSLALTATYTGMTGVKLFLSRDLNAPRPPSYPGRPDPGTGVLRTVESSGRLQSHALDVGLRGSISKFFNGQLQYGRGRAYNNTGGIGWFPADNYDFSREWARADFDMRQRFRGLGTFKMGQLFELGTLFSVNSGTPYTLTTGRDDNGDGRASDRPPGVPRNSREGFGDATLDLRASRDFKLADGEKAPGLGVSLEAFNALNRVNYTTVVGNLSSPFFGQPVAARPARRVQLRMEFTF